MEYSRLRTLPLFAFSGSMDRDHGGEAGTESALQWVIRIEHNLDRDALHNLGEVAGRVIGRQKRELRSAGRCDLRYFSVQHDPGESINGNVSAIAFLDVGKLRLLVIRLDPDIPSHQVDHFHAGGDQLPLLHMTLADRSCRRG